MMLVPHFGSNHKDEGKFKPLARYYFHRGFVVFEFETFGIKSSNLKWLLDRLY